jgi:hypothetical protein
VPSLQKASTPPFLPAWQEREEDQRTFTSFLEDAERRRREWVTEERQHRHGMVYRPHRSDDGAGLSNAPSGASGVDATDEDSEDVVLF